MGVHGKGELMPVRLASAVAALASVFLLSACGGSGSDDPEHEAVDIETAGRLVTYDTEASALKVLDLDDGQLLATLELDGSAPSLYVSPGYRYVVATQRNDDRVQFVDGGLYTEDHGDHMHDYAEPPRLLSLTLSGHRPTHYTRGETYGVIFYDGGDAASSKTEVISDAGLGAGRTDAVLALENAMHGVAELVDDRLFVTFRDASITDTTLPAAVERYRLEDGSFVFEHRYDEACPRLHGAAANGRWLGFGCSDGVLLIDLQDSSYPAIHLDNPESLAEGSRFGAVYGHPAVDELVATAGDQTFVIDPESDTRVFVPLAFDEGVGRLAQGFADNGEVFYLLGDDGVLRLFDPDDGWALESLVRVSEGFAEDGASPAVAVSAAEDRIFVLDPDARAVVEVDADDGKVLRTLNLGFTPAGLVWVGLPDDDHQDHHH